MGTTIRWRWSRVIAQSLATLATVERTLCGKENCGASVVTTRWCSGWIDLGQITPDDVYTHPQRNAILRSLGDKRDIEVDIFVERLRPGDALLLMSDGLWEMVRDERMAEIIAAHHDPQAACKALIDAANAAGGDDNITVILAHVEAY
jgi:Serine/threonine protein phosphatase